MAEPRPYDAAHPGTSLATKLVLFVFATSFGTAVLVSWTSIQATHTHLSRVVDRTYPAALERAVERLEQRVAQAPGEAPGAGL